MLDTTELADLETHCAKVARLDERLVADEDLMATVTSVASARRFLEAVEGACLAELDARGTTDIVCGLRTPGWLARETGVSPGSARARVKLARSLRLDLPGTERAVREGRLCTDRAKVLVRVTNERIVDQIRLMEDDLIEMSASMTFDAWVTHLEVLVELLDQDGPEPRDDPMNNRLGMRGSASEMRVGGKLYGDLAVGVRSAIEQVADELYRQYRADFEATGGEVSIPTRAVLRAFALGELCRRGLMVNKDGKGTKPKVEATLVINTDTPDEVFDEHGHRVGKAQDSALTCDMSVYTIILNSLGVPLDMGREIRNANREQRRALKRRDGGCAFPGCGMGPEKCDAHHVAWWWRDLGTTNVRYMVLFCRHHHMVIHRKGWSVTIGDDWWAWITTPSGAGMWGQRHGITRAGPAPPVAA